MCGSSLTSWFFFFFFPLTLNWMWDLPDLHSEGLSNLSLSQCPHCLSNVLSVHHSSPLMGLPANHFSPLMSEFLLVYKVGRIIFPPRMFYGLPRIWGINFTLPSNENLCSPLLPSSLLHTLWGVTVVPWNHHILSGLSAFDMASFPMKCFSSACLFFFSLSWLVFQESTWFLSP